MVLSLFSCGGDESPAGPPESPRLVFPENNSECLEGEVSAQSPNISTIQFRWEASSGASGYTLTIRNLNSGVTITESTTSTSFPVTLIRGTPYAWSVRANSETTSSPESATWKFFNAGDGVTSYAPFPADLIYPKSGATVNLDASGSLELRWEGADVDNDIAAYEVLFDTQDPPVTNIGGNGPAESLMVNALQPGTTYYWRIITTDESGNRSTSEVSQFATAN
ncbi:hypothetical protein D3A96_05525 [Robertkochia marina]|nr:hypothetical protein D3A96_05525 [Robertkochia marina]